MDAYGKGQMLTQEECLALVPFLTIPQPDMFNPVEPHKVVYTDQYLWYMCVCLC